MPRRGGGKTRRTEPVKQSEWVMDAAELADTYRRLEEGLALVPLTFKLEKRGPTEEHRSKARAIRQQLMAMIGGAMGAIEESPIVLISEPPHAAITSTHPFCDLDNSLADLEGEASIPWATLFGPRRLSGVPLLIWVTLKLAAVEIDDDIARGGAVSTTWLAKRMEVSDSAIEKGIANLKDLGLLEFAPHAYGREHPQQYRLRLRADESEP